MRANINRAISVAPPTLQQGVPLIRKQLVFLSMVASSLALFTSAAFSQVPPGLPSGWTDKQITYTDFDMAAAANPLAVRAGVEIPGAGGSVVDATIAVQMVLNLVEPQSSGISGSAFMVHNYSSNSRHR